MQTKADTRSQTALLARPRIGNVSTWLLALVVGVAALVPRGLHLADFLTEDESFHWVWRVRHFSGFLKTERWADTNLTGHPGVTTMWLGSAGRWLADRFGVGLAGIAEGSASPEYLAMLRLPLALVNTLAVVAGYLLLRRLLRSDIALLAGLLWALSPFIIAHSRLLHMDALLTSFMTLSVLCLIAADAAYSRDEHYSWALLLAAGTLAGLAFLTKATSLVLLPIAGLLLLWFSPPVNLGQRLMWGAVRYLLWLLCAVVVFAAVWPAMWVEPVRAVGAVLAEIANNGAVPHPTGNYFMGQPVADPGWLFYPVVVVWRSTPFLLIGLLLLPLALRDDSFARVRERRVLLALVGYVLIVALALSLAPKKFDRYLLPIWPTLTVLAACGLIWLWEKVRCTRRKLVSLYLVPAAAGLTLLAALAWYHPYYLAWFNPLVGGGTTARRVMLVGWGEGMEQVGAWLRTRPDVDHSPVLTWGPRTLEPFIPGRTAFLSEHTIEHPASYAVLYVRAVQRQEELAAQRYASQPPPLYTLRMYGIDYASVYQPPYPYEQALNAVFDTRLHLRGYSQQWISNTLVLTPSWNVQADQPGGLFSFVHVLAPDGSQVAGVDAAIDEGMFARWQAGQQFGRPFPISLPADLPPGQYRVVLGVYDPTTGERLPVTRGAALPEHIDGEGVLPVLIFRRE